MPSARSLATSPPGPSPAPPSRGRSPRRRPVRPHDGLLDRRAATRAGWITDFLNAAYYRRAAGERDVDDLRLAFCDPHDPLAPHAATAGCALADVLGLPPRVRPRPLPGRRRVRRAARSTASSCSRAPRACSATGSRTPTPTTRGAAGASRSRPPRRRAALRPRASGCASRGSARSRRPSAPPRASRSGTPTRRWRCRRRDAVVGALAQARDLARLRDARSGASRRCAAAGSPGRRSRSRSRPGTAAGRPMFTRGYVTITRLVTPGRPGRRCAPTSTSSTTGLARFGRDEPPAVPERRAAGRRLRPHDARGALHGRGQQPARALRAGRPGVRARGGHVGRRCRGTSSRPTTRAGRDAQHAFWGEGERSRATEHARTRSRIAAPAPRRRERRRASSSARARTGSPPRSRSPRAGATCSCSRPPTEPGGAVRTEELTLPGFRHDTFSSVYPAGAASPVFARAGRSSATGCAGCTRATATRTRCRDGRAAALHRDLDETAASLDALARRRRRALGAVRAPVPAALRRGARARCSGLPADRAARRSCSPGWARGRRSSSRGCCSCRRAGSADELFESAGARAWLCGAAMHGDVPPTSAGSAIAGAYLNLLGHAVGWPSPEGGAGRLADALVGRLRAARRASCARARRSRACSSRARPGRRASSSTAASASPRRS